MWPSREGKARAEELAEHYAACLSSAQSWPQPAGGSAAAAFSRPSFCPSLWIISTADSIILLMYTSQIITVVRLWAGKLGHSGDVIQSLELCLASCQSSHKKNSFKPRFTGSSLPGKHRSSDPEQFLFPPSLALCTLMKLRGVLALAHASVSSGHDYCETRTGSSKMSFLA